MEKTPEERREIARWIARHPRPKRPRVCVECGREYDGAGRSKYCRRSCQQRAYRKRTGDAEAVRKDSGISPYPPDEMAP